MGSGAGEADEMRVVEHVGTALLARSTSLCADIAARVIFDLEPGRDLYTSLEAILDERGTPGAMFNLLGGSIDALTIMTGGPGTDVPITFHGPVQIVAPVLVEAGSGVVGVDEQGGRFTHCHAVFRGGDGRLVGGHLIRGKTIVGARGLRLELLMLAGARFARRVDAETRFAIFHPEAA